MIQAFLATIPWQASLILIFLSIGLFIWGTFADKWTEARSIAIAYLFSILGIALGFVAMGCNFAKASGG
jgi:MFS family permease